MRNAKHRGVNRPRKLHLIVALYMLNATRDRGGTRRGVSTSGSRVCDIARAERVLSELWHSRRLRHASRRIAYLRPVAAGEKRPLGELINLSLSLARMPVPVVAPRLGASPIKNNSVTKFR